MNRRQVDLAVGALLVVILALGVLTSVQFLLGGTPMSGSAPAMALVMPVLVALVTASVVGGVYVFVRGRVFESVAEPGTESGTSPGEGRENGEPGAGTQTETETAESQPETEMETDEPQAGGVDREVLEVLPEDERRILDPVIESPGLTQVKLRDRSGFSKSKVSQTLSNLEERGLLYREPQGRTYRVYPAEDLQG